MDEKFNKGLEGVYASIPSKKQYSVVYRIGEVSRCVVFDDLESVKNFLDNPKIAHFDIFVYDI